jgi:hypothetical protein
LHQFIAWVDGLSWGTLILVCLILGLAPFMPPHIVEKVQMLLKGKLVRPIDWFDLILHGTPWVILLIKAVVTVRQRG